MRIPGYRIVRKINQGGMSTVYLAVQVSVGRQVALKVMSPIFNADPVFSQRFQREANIVGQLSHPNIVSIYDIGCYKNLNYIAMDFLPGGTVHDRMREGNIGPAETLRILKDVAKALDVAHEKGYVHRDIKPENILFRDDDTTVLSDFGVAKAISSASKVTNAGTVVGTPHYMSPEQSRGMTIDGRSDLYSLGIVFFEMLTGSVPFQGEESVAIAIKHLTSPIPTLPPQHSIYQHFLNRLLAKSPKERFQNGQEVVAAIESIEQTLAGNPNRRTPMTDPTDMNVMTLLRALVITSFAAIKFRVMQFAETIFRWRWTPNRGFYAHPNAKVTEIRTEVDSNEEKRNTVVSTRVRKAAHYEDIPTKKLGLVTRAFMFMFVIGVIWSAISVGLVRYNVATDKIFPSGLHETIITTASVVGEYADRALGRNTNKYATAPKQNNSVQIASSAINNDHVLQESQTDINRNRLTNVENVDTENEDIKTNLTELEKNLEENSKPVIENNEIDIAEVKEPATAENTNKPVSTYAFTVNPLPNDARIRILNIRERYRPGIELQSGRYSIEVSKDGYETHTAWHRVNGNLTLDIALSPIYQSGDTIVDTLSDGSNGPEMIVLPTGRFNMGKQGVENASPVREVEINYALAFSKYEVTFAQFEKFLVATDKSVPDDSKWGRGSRPIINVSWNDAVAYANWLSETSGEQYRLPTESEWEFAARAGTEDDYWWGDDRPNTNANCKRGCKSDYTSVFSSKSAPVGSFPANPFSIHDTAGNVAEWVMDCYQNHFSGAPVDGKAVNNEECSERVLRGGAMDNNYRALYSHVREGKSPQTTSNTIGIRLVRELK